MKKNRKINTNVYKENAERGGNVLEIDKIFSDVSGVRIDTMESPTDSNFYFLFAYIKKANIEIPMELGRYFKKEKKLNIHRYRNIMYQYRSEKVKTCPICFDDHGESEWAVRCNILEAPDNKIKFTQYMLDKYKIKLMLKNIEVEKINIVESTDWT